MALAFQLASNLIGPPGVQGSAGRTIYNGKGAPPSATGVVGDFYLDTSAYVLYGPKTSATAWPTAGQSLIGASTPQTLPNDLTANSLTVSSVSGDSNPQRIQILDASGNVKYLVDASGNLTATGAAVAAALRVTQATSQNSQGQTNAAVTFPGAFGSSTSYPLSGISSDSKGNLIFSYQGYPFMQTQNGGYSSAVGNTPVSAYAVAFSAGAYVFYGGGSTLFQASASGITLGPTTSSYSIPTTINTYSGIILQLQKNNSTVASFDTTGSGSLSGNLSVAGSITAGSITNSGQNSAQSHQATGNGTVGAPSYSFTAQTDTGMFLPTQSTTAAILGFAVNGAQILALGKASASVSGALSVSGATSLAAVSLTSSSNSGTETAAAFTISASGGRFTFGDGSYLTSAPIAQNSGVAAQFTATSTGSATAPAFTQTTNNNTGAYFTGSGSSQTLGIAVNGQNSASFTPLGLSIGTSGNGVTFSDGTLQTTAYTGQNTQAASLGVYTPCFANASATSQLQTLSSTYTALYLPGTTIPQQFVAQSGQAFYAAAITVNSDGSSGALTFRLQNITDNTTLYTSGSIAKGTITATATAASASTYPMTANKTYQWQVIGSGTANCCVTPQYYTPASSSAAAQYWGPSVLNSTVSTTLSSTYTAMLVPGQNEASYYYNPGASYLYGATFYNAGTAAVTFQMAGTATYTSPSVAAGGSLTVGPFGPSTCSFAAKTSYFWKVAGSGTANVALTMQVVS